MDRQKLSKVVLEHLRERERESTGMSRLQHRVGRYLNRFSTLTIWEKAVVAGGAIIIVMAIPAAIVAFSSGGGDDASSGTTTSRRTPVRSEFPTATPQAEGPTPKPVAVGGSPPTPTPVPNRRDCDAIEGTPYQSDEERDWYADNCDEEEPTPTSPAADGGNPTPRPPTQPPTQPPVQPTQPPSQGLTAAGAASAAAQFLGVSSGSCHATDAGSYWSVTCGSTRVCVFENPTLVDYC